MEVSWVKLLPIVIILTVHTRSCYGGDYDDTEMEGEDLTPLQPRYAYKPPDQKCLEYRHANVENQKTLLSLPNFHGNKASEPIEALADGSVVIQNEIITNFGNWLNWRECPKGMYVMGYQGFLLGTVNDHAGLYYINFVCRTPGGNETGNIIEACTPNFCSKGRPAAAGKRAIVCTGTVVGFSLLVPQPRRNGADQVGTDAFEGRCSVKVRTHNEQFGRALNQYGWTKPVFCDKHQAMCGFQVQMQDYIPSRDNTAMNNLRIKCCPVPDPLKDCEPTEERAFIRTCDNSDSAEGLRCDFGSRIGLSVDYENEKTLIFYSSIGYDFLSIKDEMKEKIISRLKNDKEYTMEYPWKNVTSNVVGPEVNSIKTICLEPHESVELYQIVGQCGYFWVRTNLFVKIITMENGREYDEYFHV